MTDRTFQAIESARHLVQEARSGKFRKAAASVSLDLAEALVELSGGRPNRIDRRRVDLGDYVRAGGDVECEGTRGLGRVVGCGRPYHEHPVVPGFEWLRRLCDGRFVKL